MMTPTATVFVIDDHEAVAKKSPSAFSSNLVRRTRGSLNHSDANDNP
jgi:hypothetical protein